MAHPHSPYPPPPPPPKRAAGGGKVLPIAVGAGLAVGVFVGLLLIRGPGGDAEASGEPTPDAAVVAKNNPPDAAPVAVDAAPPVDAAPAIKKAVLTFAIEPDDVDGVEIEIDEKEIEGTSHEIVLGDKDEVKVKVKASARGYRSFRTTVDVTGDQTVAVTMRKRRRNTGTRPDTGTKPGTGKRPGGIIDL